MTDQKNALAALFLACSRDEALKARFMNDPRAVLMEHGVDVPEDREIRVVENTHVCHHLTLPLLPSARRAAIALSFLSPNGEERTRHARGEHPGGRRAAAPNRVAGPRKTHR